MDLNIPGLKFRGTVFPLETGPSDAEAKEIDQLVKQSLKEVANEEILKIAHSIKHETIDQILAMDDVELAIAVLSGKIKMP
jgi:hypothetical protein